ncbi:MAG: WD40 repeat domain-containing protein, partial [Kovacikia sp.]
LIPWLQQKWGKHFVSLMFTPDRDPFESLYGSLLSRGYSQSQAQVAKAGKAETLSQVVKTLKPPESFWLIFIDQFEELFTVSEGQSRDRFITSLVKLNRERVSDPHIRIVATMRADFLDQLDLAPANLLARITEKHRPLITQMQPDELRLVIEQPAAHHGVVFGTGLVEEIITEVQGQAGCLPLLQYTLDRLWETEAQDGVIQTRTLNISTYHQLGGVRGALQQRVEQIYGALSEVEQLAAQRIFLKLVEIGGDEAAGTEWKPIRRRANRSEFGDELEQRALTQLINENLLVSNRPAQSQESTVEIAHEVLLTSWTLLRDLIQRNRKAIADRNRISDQWRRWKQTKSNDDLLRGSMLANALELKEDETFQQVLHGFSSREEKFIRRSQEWRDRQRRRMMAGFMLVFALITAIALFAGTQWIEAEKQLIISTSRQSESLSGSDQGFGALIASLSSGRKLQRVRWMHFEPEVERQALTALQDAVYGIRESNTLEGHKGAVNSISFNRNGQTLVSASADGTVKLWDPHGKLLKTLKAHNAAIVYNVSFSRDGQTLACANADGTIQLWSLDGTLLKTIPGHASAVYRVNFSRDGQVLASASADGTIKFWTLDGRLIKTVKGHDGEVYGVNFSPDGQTLASASLDGTIKLWKLDGSLIRTVKVSNRAVLRVGFSPDGQKLVTTSDDGNIKFWSKDGEELAHLFQEGVVYHAIFSPDGKVIASGGGDTMVRLWSKDAILLHTFQGYTEGILGLAFSPDGQTIASASEDGTIKLWKRDSIWVHTLQGHSDEVTDATFSPDGKIVASASHDKTVKLWSRAGALLKTLVGHTDVVHGISFSPDGKTIASASWDRALKLWRVEDGHLLKTFMGHSGKVYGVSFSPDGKMLASTSNDGSIKLWNLNGDVLKTLQGHMDVVHNVRFSHDGKLLVSASHDRTVKLWRVEDGKLLKTFIGHTNWVHKVDFSPDDQLIVSASWDRTIKLWSAKDGSLVRTFAGHTDKALGVSFSPDGGMIASSSDDKTLKLWKLDGTLVATLRGHNKAIHNVSFSPDGKTLASASYDSTVILWDVENRDNLDTLLGQGCDWGRDYLQNNPTLNQTRDIASPEEVRHLCD